MKRISLSICFAVFAALAMPASAQDAGDRVQEAIIAQLSGQGFTHVRISTTFLGRIRIFATAPGTTREIILNPRTGEILRDYWDDEDDFSEGLVSSSRSGSDSGSSSRNDDDGGQGNASDGDDAREDSQDDSRDNNGDSADDTSDDTSDDGAESKSSVSSDDDESASKDEKDAEDEKDAADEKDSADEDDSEDDNSEGDD